MVSLMKNVCWKMAKVASNVISDEKVLENSKRSFKCYQRRYKCWKMAKETPNVSNDDTCFGKWQKKSKIVSSVKKRQNIERFFLQTDARLAFSWNTSNSIRLTITD